MDQTKVGAFLKDLRKEKEITQEQLAEELGVSGRTISRWETGKNMPDISLLVEIAEFFDVSIPEIIKGERKSESMEEEVKEVAETMSDYAKAEKLHNELLQRKPAYDYWIAKSLILQTRVLMAKPDLFQAEHTLKSVIDNYKVKDDNILLEANQLWNELMQIKNMPKSIDDTNTNVIEINE